MVHGIVVLVQDVGVAVPATSINIYAQIYKTDSGLSKQKESKQIWKTSRLQKCLLYVRIAVEKIPELEFLNNLWGLGTEWE
jgi:hypothetical protein